MGCFEMKCLALCFGLVAAVASAADNVTLMDAKCMPDGTCSGSCGLCKTAMNTVIGLLSKEGCAAIIPEGAALCEAAGLGPEDPLADACASAVVIGCPIAASMIAKGAGTPEAVCDAVGQCGTCCSGRKYYSVHNCCIGKRCGCLADGQCVSEIGSVADCCSGRGSRSYWHCEGRHRCEGSTSAAVTV